MRGFAIAALLAGLLPLPGCSEPPARPAADDPAAPALSSLDSLIAEGEALYWEGEYEGARHRWDDALPLAAAAGDVSAEPRILTWLGLAAWRQGDYAEARRLGERALALKRERGLRAELARSYNALGLLAWNEGRLADAAALLRSSGEEAAAQGDEAGAARAAGNLGLVHTEFADFERARESFLAMRAAGRRLGDARIEGNALSNLAMLDVRLGDPAVAVERLAEARRLYRGIDYGAGEQHALGQQGTAYAALGEPARALAALDSALELSRRQGLRQEEASNQALIGSLYASLGDAQRALRHFREALALDAGLGLRLQEGNTRRSIGAVHARLGDLARARESVHAALDAHRAAGARFEELDDLLLLAEIAQLDGAWTEASSHLRDARRLAGESGSSFARARVALVEARVADGGGRPREVLRALADARSELAGGDAAAEWEVHALRARAFDRLGLPDSAVAAGRSAVALVERVRGNLKPGPLRTAYTADRALAYSDLVVGLLRLGRAEEAFETADAARGRALLEHLGAARHAAAGGAPVRDLASAERLLRQIDALVARLSELERLPDTERGEAATATRDLAQRLAEARGEYESLLLRVAQRSPGTAALLSARRVAAAEVAAVLAPGELLVQYLVTPERLLIFAVDAAGLHTLESALPAAELESRVRLARDLLSRPGADDAASHAVAGGLYAALIEPLRAAGLLRDARRLILVPHQALTYLPFAALREPRSGRRLAEEHALLVLPAAGALPLLREREAAAGREAAAAPTAFAPFPNRLPATRREAREFRRTVPRARARVGTRATEAAVRRELERGGLVHIASHGVMNARNPMFSRVELARGATMGSAEDDGRLEVHELLGLSIRTPLVFLSGCETGLGGGWSTDFARGEDYATLAQAFLYAGAANVVATLWRIDDDGAAAFAERFYRHLRTLPPPEALAAAQREMRRHPDYRHPYYWAGYVLNGGGSPARPRR
jgi:CHAT domain-containing protein/tetratricopeptide (TPR) repeat protein